METITLTVSAEDAAALRALCQALRTQDNRCTADPVFAVQQIREQHHVGIEEADRWEWVPKDGDGERVDDVLDERLTDIYMKDSWERSDEEEELLEQHYRVGVIEYWETVTTALTEAGCERHLAMNRHNLLRPRIYALGGYRNPELHLLRRVLASIGPDVTYTWECHAWMPSHLRDEDSDHRPLDFTVEAPSRREAYRTAERWVADNLPDGYRATVRGLASADATADRP